MSTNDRDTHFQEFARLLFPEVSKLFFTLYARISELSPIEKIDSVEDEIRTLLAQRAYDLAYHILTHETMDIEAEEYRSVDEVLASDIPDMTAWPKPD